MSTNLIETATRSAGGGEWEIEECLEVDVSDNVNDPELSPESAKLYRAVAARLNYIAPDRPDIAYEVKEAARSMSSPRDSDFRMLRKI